MKKTPKSNYSFSNDKKPKTDPKNRSFDSETPSWKFCILDFDGRWGWCYFESIEQIKEIKEKIKNFESMSWSKILQNGNNHEVSISKLCREAQKRLEELKMDDTEALLSLRLSGKERIWGIKVGNVCKLLWWDPHHEVCPSALKHT